MPQNRVENPAPSLTVRYVFEDLSNYLSDSNKTTPQKDVKMLSQFLREDAQQIRKSKEIRIGGKNYYHVDLAEATAKFFGKDKFGYQELATGLELIAESFDNIAGQDREAILRLNEFCRHIISCFGGLPNPENLNLIKASEELKFNLRMIAKYYNSRLENSGVPGLHKL